MLIDRIRKALLLPAEEALEAIRALVSPPVVTDNPKFGEVPITNLPIEERRTEVLIELGLDAGAEHTTPDNRPATVYITPPPMRTPEPLTPAQLAQMEADRRELNRQSEEAVKQMRKGMFE